MVIELWLREGRDEKRFQDVCKGVELKKYFKSNILTGCLEGNNEGKLSALRKEFVLGRIKKWKPKDAEQLFPFVRIDNNSVYPDGLVLTPYSEIDVKYHLKGRTIDERTMLSRVELFGGDNDDFIMRAFTTYDKSPQINKAKETDSHFILYEAINP